jgi:hypothetical protein
MLANQNKEKRMKPTFQHLPAADDEGNPNYTYISFYHFPLYLVWAAMCAINGLDLI